MSQPHPRYQNVTGPTMKPLIASITLNEASSGGFDGAKDVIRVFRPEKAAQASAYLISLAPGRSLERVKLMKLLYLADRESLIRYGASITGDRMMSMQHGPVLSNTLSALQGGLVSAPAFDSLIESKGVVHSLAHGLDDSDIGDLSRADIEILDAVWQEHGHMPTWNLRDWTHVGENCPEWEDPHGSSFPIDVREMLVLHGVGPDEVEDLVGAERAMDELATLLIRL